MAGDSLQSCHWRSLLPTAASDTDTTCSIGEQDKVADTWHESIAEAMYHAAFEFRVRDEESIDFCS